MAQISRSSLVVAKGVSTIKGDYYFNHKNYVIAINHYGKSIKQNPKDVYAMLRMAESYHKTQKDELASQWYNKAFAINPDVEEDYILKYISFLNTLGKHDELRRWITIYHDRISKNSPNAASRALYNDSAVFILNHPVSVNSGKSDSGPFLYHDKLIFSSDRAATGNGSYKLYKSVLDAKLELGEVMPFHESISSGPNHGAIAIATEPSRLFFTEISQPSADGAALMKISYCDVPTNPSDVLKVKALAFKNFNHSMGHPAINSKGTVMFFAASSQRHTHGFDLYKSEYNGKKWSTPVALGAAVNTHGDEMYPTLHNDSILYFASNVKGGLGGFDVYKVNILDKNPQVEHLNAPVNSPLNDFGLVINNAGTEGYLSSDRPGGLGGDDLYKFYILPVKTTRLTGDNNVSNHEVLFIYTSRGDEIKLFENNMGNLKFDFTPGRMYNLTVEYDNFKTGAVNTTTSATPLPKFNIYTFDIQKSAETHAKKNKIAPIQNIHINPGDLVTFQLTPNLKTDSWTDNGKIQFHNAETIVGDRESIVFSYVAAGGPKISEVEDTAPITDLSALDTVSSTPPVAAKETQNKPGKVSTTDASKAVETTTQDKLVNTATTADAVKPINEVSNPDALATADSVVNTEAITEQRRVAYNQTENLVTPTKPTVSTPEPKTNTLSDSLNGKSVASKKETKDPSQLPALNVTTLQDQIVSAKDKNVDSNAVKTDLQNTPLVKTAGVFDDNKSSDSLNSENYVSNHAKDPALNSDPLVLKNSLAKDVAQLSPAHANAETNQVGSDDKNIHQDVKAIHSDETVQNELTAAKEITDISKLSDFSNRTNAKQDGISNLSPSTSLNDENPLHAIPENSDFEYRVQIAASRSKLSDAHLKKIYRGTHEIRVFKEEGYFKYYIDQTPGYPAARHTLQESGVDQAFITVYKGDTKWKLNEAIAFQKNQQTVQALSSGESESSDPMASKLTAAVAKKTPAMNSLVSSSTAHASTVSGENNDFQYRLQIAASKFRLSDARLKKIYSGTTEIRSFKEDGLYKYYIQATSNYFVARQTLKECNVEHAFISAYQGEAKRTLQDVIALQYKVPLIESELAKTDSIVKIITVNFDLDEFVLPPDQVVHLREAVIDEIKVNDTYHAIVNGYTDIQGSGEYNFGLSQERALFVEQLIVKEGINSEKVTTRYFGESQVIKYCPEHEHCDESVHQANRRVEILLLTNKK